MTKSVAAARIDLVQWRRAADWLAMALAASLPWSTSATLVIAGLWLVALLPTIEKDDVRAMLASPAAWLVLALIAFGAVGMLWADAPFKERFRGFDSYLKLLALPLLFIHFRRSENAVGVLYAFVASCAVLLVLAFVSFASFSYGWFEIGKKPGVPVKDTIAQSAEFALAGSFCLILAIRRWRANARAQATGLALLAVAFFADIGLLVGSRTGLASVPVLLVAVAVKSFAFRRAAATAVAGLVVVGAVGLSSETVRDKIARAWSEVETYQETNANTSAGARLEFWRKSVGFIAEAPLIGHGTGSIRSQFARVATGEGASGLIADNPHNQTLAVGIQLGFAGMALLCAMWIAHLMLFRGPSLAAAIGALVVVQNIFGSLLNSHLFDFTHGWLYVVGVGVAGGVMLKGVGASEASASSQAADVARP
ncbi:MAG: O-antigen ligase family protein [Pseudorhodoplanes sp.]|nr:O-antigen ligase family protein [Pseudorhodoplanes sp.]